MPQARILEDRGRMEEIILDARKLAAAGASTLPFHQLEIPLAWWDHFGGADGTDFGTRRGRNFYGTRTVVQKPLMALVENGGVTGIAPLVLSQVSIRGSKEPIKMVSFCADSVVIFFQDLLIHPARRAETIDAMCDLLAGYAEENRALLFLGHIPEDSPNIPHLDKAWGRLLAKGWQGGAVINRFRGGVYPWTLHKLHAKLESILKSMEEGDPDRAHVAELIDRLERQGPTLLNFSATRLALEKEIGELGSRLEAGEAFREAAAGIRNSLRGDYIAYPYLTLAADRDTYLQGLSSSKRYYFRRYRKKFEEAGGRFETVEPADITEAEIEDFLRLHKLRWGSDSVAVNSATLDFHREICRHSARNGVLRMFFAHHGGRRVAAHLCFDIGNRREYFFSGRDPEAEELRVGKLLVMETILDAHDRRMAIYDFGYGGDEYKADFTSVFRRVRSYFLAREGRQLDLENLFPKYEHFIFESEPSRPINTGLV